MGAVSWILREHGAAHPDLIAGLHLHGSPGREWEEDAGVRAETDQPEASPLGRPLTGLAVGDDTARDRPRDLPPQDAAAGPAQPHRRLLVIEARLLLGRV